MTEPRSRPRPVRTEDIQSVGELRAVLAQIPDDVVCGPYFAEYSPSDHRLDVHPVND
jgi:hypothetical protein